MASAKMFSKNINSSFFQQQSAQGHHYTDNNAATNGHGLLSGDDDTVLTLDMHVKMSKKIAQLTKVIYSLNTKADEHEIILNNLKQQYEQEKCQLAKEASKKVADLRQRVETLSLKKKTQSSSLEEKICILELERQSQNDEISRLQQVSNDRERTISEEFRTKLSQVKQRLENIKEQFTINFDEKLKSLEQKHQYDIQLLKEKHQHELDSLKNELKQLYDIEITAQTQYYNQSVELLRTENRELCDKYEQQLQNIREQKQINEREIQYENDLQKLTKEIQYNRLEHERQLNEKNLELKQKTNECDHLRNELKEIENNLHSRSENISSLNEQLMKQRIDYEHLHNRCELTTTELNTVKERFNRQSNDLEEKLKLTAEKDLINRQLNTELAQCKKQLQLNIERLKQLESERNALLSKTETTSSFLELRIVALDKTINELTNEKQQLLLKYDNELAELRLTYDQQVKLCKTEMQNEIDRLKENFKQILKDEQEKAHANLLEREQQLREQYETEKIQLLNEWKSEINLEKSQQDDVKIQLKNLKEKYQNEIQDLKQRLQLMEKDFHTAQLSMTQMESTNVDYKNQIEKLLITIDDETKTSLQIKSKYDDLKSQYDELINSSTIKLKEELEKLSTQLNDKWSKTLKSECEKIRLELLHQKDEEKNLSIEELKRLKDNELSLLKEKWHLKCKDLENQLDSVKNQLLSEQQRYKEETLVSLKNVNEDKKRTINEFNLKIQELTTQIQRLQSQNQDDLFQQKIQIQKEHVQQLNELKTQQMEDIRAQQLAHNNHLTMIRSEAEKTKHLELEKQHAKYQTDLENVQKDNKQKFLNEKEELTRSHVKEVAAIRAELERAIEITKIKEREADLRIEDLTSDLQSRQDRVDTCMKDLGELQLLVENLRVEIDNRSKEIQRVRSEANKEIKSREETLNSMNEQKLKELNSKHTNDQQLLIQEFTKAHEMLKAKVNELQIQLDQAEQRYRNRESRPEDLELIANLHQTIVSYQDQLKKIHEEKKHLKMELVNRETNFNKVFSNAPTSNVGVMNPLSFNTKFVSKADALPSRLKSQSPRPPRLDPLPSTTGVPHDLTLNPNKPLPPKKYVK